MNIYYHLCIVVDLEKILSITLKKLEIESGNLLN